MLVFFCQKRGLKKQNFHTKTAINYISVWEKTIIRVRNFSIFKTN